MFLVVQLMRLGTGLRSDVVTVDEEGGAYEAVAHLLRLGYTRIGMLNGPNVSTSRRRFAGYQQALKAWRRRVDPGLVVASDFRVEAGYESGITLLRRRPDAVFVANYLMAVGFMQALRQYPDALPRGHRDRDVRRSPLAGWVRAAVDDDQSTRV